MGNESRLTRRPFAIAAAVLGFVMLAVYLSLIASQGDGSLSDALPWALPMTIAAIIALASALVGDDRMALKLLIAAAVLFGVLGVLAIFTIGLGFLLAGAVSLIAITRLKPQR